MEYSHYDEVPAHLQQKIIAAGRPQTTQKRGASGSQVGPAITRWT
jgi:hypothetical protein